MKQPKEYPCGKDHMHVIKLCSCYGRQPWGGIETPARISLACAMSYFDYVLRDLHDAKRDLNWVSFWYHHAERHADACLKHLAKEKGE